MRGFFPLRFALVTAFVGGVAIGASGMGAQTAPPAPTSTLNKQQPKPKTAAQAIVPPAPVSAPGAPSAPQQPLSLLQEPAQRAQVRLDSEGLFIQANNSSLSQILREISSDSGMKLDGLGRDERIFGSYGPGSAREVLGQLLEGTGYNVLMVGETTKGAPRELTLTPRNASHSPNMASTTPARRAEEEEDTAEPEPEPQQQTPIQQPLPQQAPPGQPNNGVKTPQQLLEELRRMREQNSNQNQNQNQNPQPDPQSQAPQ